MNGRQLALTLLDAWNKEKMTLQDALARLDPIDEQQMRFGREIAWGVLRYFTQLEALLLHLNDGKTLKIKKVCKFIGYMALYQYLYMDSAPIYAIVNESVELAKKRCRQQAPFLNALLRKMEQLPDIKSLDPHEQVSMPPYLYEKLKGKFDLESTLMRPKVMMRAIRDKDLPLIAEYEHCKVYEVKSGLTTYLSQDAYVQNRTHIELMYHLYDPTFEPLHILDLCASPGGKLTMASLLFPSAELFANDLNTNRLEKNLARMKIEAHITEGNGTDYPDEQKFDLIILDLPCSGTGVMSKKPEAKYRINDEELNRLQVLQQSLIAHAKTLLSDGGQVWILTCSVLPEENQALLEFANQCKFKQMKKPLTIYPDFERRDGGFAVAYA